MSTTRKRVYGYLAEFKSASAMYKGAEKIRDAGFKKWDCYSPYPIHGLDGAMGIKRSILPWFVFFGGITGTVTAFVLAYLTQVVIYPTIVQGKPAKRIVSSNMIGKNAGTVNMLVGFPCTRVG